MRRLVLAGLLCALAPARAEEFPDWRTPSTLGEISWRTRPPDSSLSEDGTWYVSVDSPDFLRQDSLVWLDVRLHPILSLAMWPIEKVANPLARYVLEPLEVPARYAERTEITDRGMRLVQLDSAGKIMLYPTMVMDGGMGSRLGGTFIDNGAFGPGSYLRLGGSIMINRDWYASLNLVSPSLSKSGVRSNLRLSAARSGEQAIWIPGEMKLGSGIAPGIVWEARERVEWGVDFLLGRWGTIEPTLRFARFEVRSPARRAGALDTLPAMAWFDHGDRGVLPGTENSLQTGFVWGRSNVDFEGTPSEGGTQSLALLRSWSDGGGDAVSLSMDATRYLLLGTEKYGYRKGDLDPYLKLSPKAIVSVLDPSTLRKRLTQRRILALQFSARRMWELDPDHQPVSYFNFPSYGGDAPARAYGGRRLMDRSVVGGSAEYRWPIWKFIDGSMFAEVAWAGKQWWEPNATGFAPGTGLGLRVRTPKQFLFRAQFAYGLEGPRAIVTVSPEF